MNWELILTGISVTGTLILGLLYGLAMRNQAIAENLFAATSASLKRATNQLKETEEILRKRNEYVKLLETKLVDSAGPDELVDMFNHLLLSNDSSGDHN